MHEHGGSHYRNAEIATASPQKLQLTLIESALRFGRRACELWHKGDPTAARESLARCQAIVIQLLGGMNRDVAPELVATITEVYTFLVRHLTDAYWQADVAKIEEALAVLEIERDTWRTLCTAASDETSAAIPRSRPPASLSLDA